VHALLGDVAGVGTGIVTAGIRVRAAAVNIFPDVSGPCVLALGCNVAVVGTGHATAGILGRTAAVDGRAAAMDVFADICGPCAPTLGCTRRTAVQKFANWSGDACMLAMSLRWAKLRWRCGGIVLTCVRLCLAVVWVSQLSGVCGGVVNASRCNEICFKCKLLMR